MGVVKLGEEVRLVFDRVFGRSKEFHSINGISGGIMASGDGVKVLAPTLLESAKLDEFVAHDVGVRREATADGINGVGDDIVPIFFMEIDFFEMAAVFASDVGCDFNVFLGGAVNESVFLLHTDANVEDGGIETLFFKEVNDDGTVDATRD